MSLDILDALDGVKKISGGWQARCPAHDDREPSLSISVGEDGRVLLNCFAGCAVEEITAALGLRLRDLFADTDASAVRPLPRVPLPPLPTDLTGIAALTAAAAARIGDARDHPAVRYAANRFGLTFEDVKRLGLGYTTQLGGGPRLVVPFRDGFRIARGFQARAMDPDATVRWLSPRSPQRGTWARVGWFRGSNPDAPVFVTEGPGDALTAVSLGFHAIAIRGAGSASHPGTQQAVQHLAGGRHLLVCGDGDAAGQQFNDHLATALRRNGAWVTVVPMPDGTDLTDFRRTTANATEWIKEHA